MVLFPQNAKFIEIFLFEDWPRNVCRYNYKNYYSLSKQTIKTIPLKIHVYIRKISLIIDQFKVSRNELKYKLIRQKEQKDTIYFYGF